MMNSTANLQKHLYKVCFDGYDLINRVTTYKFHEFEILHSKNHTIMHSFDKINDFYQYCMGIRRFKLDVISNYLPTKYLDKYEIGFFKIEKGLNFDENYICFSDSQIEQWGELNILGLEFIVVFSRNLSGELNGFGMRVVDQSLVFNSFKWLFPMGQHCTFGLDTIDNSKDLILVEGFRDMVAGKESGYQNIVGLGSIEVTDGHLKFLPDDRNYKFCYDQDRYGYEMRKKRNECFFTPMNYKDPWEAFISEGRVEFIFVSNEFEI